MLTIGQVSKLAGMSTRTIRHYESLGLVLSIQRGENNYRYYKSDVIPVLERIRDLQSLGFTLEEIGQILPVNPDGIVTRLRDKLEQVDKDLDILTMRRQRLEHLLSSLKTEGPSSTLTDEERNLLMETIREHAIAGLKEKDCFDRLHLEAFEREVSVYNDRDRTKFFDALRSCLDFARNQGLKIGPGRGYASSSLILFALGVTDIDPVLEELVPERMSILPPEIHIDVEYGRGQVFVDFCRKISDGLAWGSIHAFRMPLIDIVNNVCTRLGLTWEALRVTGDDPAVLSLISRGDIDKIFLLDYSPSALIRKYENFLPDFVDGEKLKTYLTSQKIYSLRDLFNIIALWHPTSSEKIVRIDRYKEVKQLGSRYTFLTAEEDAVLKPNFGLIIYHEDIIKLIELATGWDPERCASLRRAIFLGQVTSDLDELYKIARPELVSLLTAEARFTFCKSHIHAHCRFTEATAFLKTYHREAYLSEVARWENQHGLMYDDIGVRFKGVSLLQN